MQEEAPRRLDPALAWGAAAPGVFVLLWAAGFVFAKWVTPYSDPMTLLAIRFALAAALIGAFARWTRAPWPTRREARHAAVVGVLVHTTYIGGVFVAIDQGLPAGVSSLIVGLQPLLSACAVGPLLGERVRALQWLGLVLGLLGVALVLEGKLHGGGATVGAVAIAVIALLGTTAGTLYQKRFGGMLDLRTATTVQYVAAALACLALAAAFEPMHVELARDFVLGMAFMVLVLSAGASTLLMVLIRRGEIARTASLFYLVPPVTALYAWLWFDERLGVLGLVGVAVTALGVALVQRSGRARQATGPAPS